MQKFKPGDFARIDSQLWDAKEPTYEGFVTGGVYKVDSVVQEDGWQIVRLIPGVSFPCTRLTRVPSPGEMAKATSGDDGFANVAFRLIGVVDGEQYEVVGYHMDITGSMWGVDLKTPNALNPVTWFPLAYVQLTPPVPPPEPEIAWVDENGNAYDANDKHLGYAANETVLDMLRIHPLTGVVQNWIPITPKDLTKCN